MPSSVYDLASQMKVSSVSGTGTRASGEVTSLSPSSGMAPSPMQSPFMSHIRSRSAYLVPENNYQWKGRLTRAQLAEAGASKEEQRRYAGMVRMKESTGGSAFLTFRVMMEGSSGWIVKAQPGQYLARNVAEHLQPIAEAALQEALRRESLATD
jgi:hypothetical protein